MWRWNDKLRPVELSEIEKQAHKMLVACVLWHESSKNLDCLEQVSLAGKIIEGALFDYFFRLIITDIKPPVFYKIRENRDHYRKLTDYALSRLAPILQPLGPFWERMRAWHYQERPTLDRKILSAAHLYASQWEFRLIRPFNHMDDEMDGIARSFSSSLAKYENLPGMKALLDSHNALGRFANLCGQLRFQIRWTQAPRVPATTVLGHMFMVATFAYILSMMGQMSQARANNNFFGGLFHDFPELLTRDIISPVKKSFSELGQIIREYENSELERRVLSPLREAGFDQLVQRMSYYLGLEAGSEFQECYRKDGMIIKCADFNELQTHDKDENDPRDGQLIKICDLLGAFLEAHNSIQNGIASSHLMEARSRLKSQLMDIALPYLKLEALLADYD